MSSIAIAGAPPALRGLSESKLVRRLLIGVALLFLALFLVLPLLMVFIEALRKGFGVYFENLAEPDALSAIKLTLLVAAIAVPANLVFGVAASWAIAKFDFVGKTPGAGERRAPDPRSRVGREPMQGQDRRQCSAAEPTGAIVR